MGHRNLQLALALATAAAAFALGRVTVDRGAGAMDAREALLDPSVRAAVLEELVRESEAGFDLHVDPEVGRTLLPGLDGVEFRSVRMSTNRFGLREREFDLPKGGDVLRVVLLGDSMVFGSGVAADERFGVQLESLLREGASGGAATIECLHVGVPSWNIVNEAAFLRRQLTLYDPDLVVHVVVPNDLNDGSGVRGTGVRANVSPLHRDRANSMLTTFTPQTPLGFSGTNYLNRGLDWESRERFARARAAILGLSDAVEAGGGRYQLLVNWGVLLPVAEAELASALRDDQVIYLPSKSFRNHRLTLGPGDPHWNPTGHEKIAELIYGICVKRSLLPSLALTPIDRATRRVELLHAVGAADALAVDPTVAALEASSEPRRILLPDQLNDNIARQVHGGLDRAGRIGPYASFLLAAGEVEALLVAGRFLERPELAGTTVRVFVDEFAVGELTTAPGVLFEERFDLPTGLDPRPFATVRFESDDFVHLAPDNPSCRVLSLSRIELR